MVPFVVQGKVGNVQGVAGNAQGVAGNTQGVAGNAQGVIGGIQGTTGSIQGASQGAPSVLETSKPQEEKIHRSRKIKPLLPPTVLQPQTSGPQSQANTPQLQTVVSQNSGSHGKNKVLTPPVLMSSTLPSEDPAKEALKATEHVLSELTPKKEDDRLDAITAESFFAVPAEENLPAKQSIEPLPEIPEMTTSEPLAPRPVSSLPEQSSLPPSQLLPEQSPLPIPPLSEQSPLPSQQPILPTQLATPLATPQTINEAPLTPFIPKESSPIPSRRVCFACGPHHISTQLPHDNFSLLSFSSFDGPLTHGKKREKVIQWLKTQEEASMKEEVK